MLLDKSQSGRKNCRICTEMAQSQRQEHVVKDYDKGDGGARNLAMLGPCSRPDALPLVREARGFQKWMNVHLEKSYRVCRNLSEGEKCCSCPQQEEAHVTGLY